MTETESTDREASKTVRETLITVTKDIMLAAPAVRTPASVRLRVRQSQTRIAQSHSHTDQSETKKTFVDARVVPAPAGRTSAENTQHSQGSLQSSRSNLCDRLRVPRMDHCLVLLEGMTKDKKMSKGYLPRVRYHQVYSVH